MGRLSSSCSVGQRTSAEAILTRWEMNDMAPRFRSSRRLCVLVATLACVFTFGLTLTRWVGGVSLDLSDDLPPAKQTIAASYELTHVAGPNHRAAKNDPSLA